MGFSDLTITNIDPKVEAKLRAWCNANYEQRSENEENDK